MRSPLRVELVEQRLENAVSPPWQVFGLKSISGWVRERRCVIYATPSPWVRNGSRRVLEAKFIPDGEGTRIEGEFRLKRTTMAFTLVFAVMILFSTAIAVVREVHATGVSVLWHDSSLYPPLGLVVILGLSSVLGAAMSSDLEERLIRQLNVMLETGSHGRLRPDEDPVAGEVWVRPERYRRTEDDR